MAMRSADSISAYIAASPRAAQPLLKQMRSVIKKAAPKAKEEIKYGIPTYVGKKNLVHFGLFKTHIGFFPAPSGIAAFKEEFSRYKTSKGAVQFPLDAKLPLPLITKVVKYRVREDAK